MTATTIKPMAVLLDADYPPCLYAKRLTPAVRTVAAFLGAGITIRTANPMQTRDEAMAFLKLYDGATNPYTHFPTPLLFRAPRSLYPSNSVMYPNQPTN